MEESYLYTHKLAVGYHGVPLIEEIALQVKKGEILTLIGPNGSGKSTILKSLIRQLAPVRGTVYLDGRSMQNMSEGEIAKKMSVLMTQRVSPELMTCGDVAATGRYPYTGRLGILSQKDWDKVREAMELVHAEELFHTDFSQISDGQRQRVLLARAICQEPEVIVLDEPTSFLDIRYKLELLGMLRDLVQKQHLAVIVSLHELDLAQRISTRVMCVHRGQIQRYGTPEEIFSGDYVHELYGVDRGSYNPRFGCLEMERVTGTPQVFVIGGNGSGIPMYRRLQRMGIPFAAGILPENDIDYEVAKGLAAQVIAQPAYTWVEAETVERARALLMRCEKILCCLTEFGPLNQYNRELAICRPEQTIWPPFGKDFV